MAASNSNNTEDLLRRINLLNEKNCRLKKKVDALTYQCTMQAKILNSGNLSTLQVLLDQLMVYINSHLRKIEIELKLAEYDANDTIALYKFREFLLSIYNHLGSFLVFSQGFVNVEMRRLQDKHTEIGDILIRLNGMPHEIMVEILDEQDRLYEHIKQIVEDKSLS